MLFATKVHGDKFTKDAVPIRHLSSKQQPNSIKFSLLVDALCGSKKK